MLCRLVGAFRKSHGTQIVIAAIVAGVALRVRDGGREFVYTPLSSPIFSENGGRI